MANPAPHPATGLTAAMGVPYVFATGGGDTIPPEHASAPTLPKPYTLASLEAVLARI